MENENKVKRIVKAFLPLLFSLIAIAFLFGTMLTYTLTTGDEEFKLNLINVFDSSLVPTWPIICVLVLLFVGGLLPLLTLIDNDILRENVSIIATFSFLFGICFLVAYREMFNYFVKSNETIINFHKAHIGYGLGISISFSIFGCFASLLSSDKKFGDSVRSITEDGILISLSLVLSFIKLPITTDAGSINFQMLPLFIIALRRGPLHGFVSGGIIYGLLSCLTDGYGIETYPFDYLIGFGSVAILGFFKNIVMNKEKPVWMRELVLFGGCMLATFVRYIGSCTSSLLFYNVDFAGALLYNAIYIPVSGLIAAAVVMLALIPLTMINDRFPVKNN